jgi:hypothetical protein
MDRNFYCICLKLHINSLQALIKTKNVKFIIKSVLKSTKISQNTYTGAKLKDWKNKFMKTLTESMPLSFYLYQTSRI